jgi:hypothetical protein
MDHFGLSFWSKNVIYDLSITEKQKNGEFKEVGKITGNAIIESDNDAMNIAQKNFLVAGYNKFYNRRK